MEALLAILWKISWQTALLAGVVFILSRLTRRAPASWRYGLWLIVLVKFLVPPFAQVPGEWVKWQRSEPHQAISVSAAPSALQVAVPDSDVTYPPAASASSGVHTPVTTAQADKAPLRPHDLLPFLWIAGASVMAGLLMVKLVRQAMVVRASTPSPGEVIELLTECAGQLGLKRMPGVRFSDAAQTPMLLGLLRPTILLPPQILDSCGREDLRAILLHEAAHVKRFDMAGLWLEQLVKVMFFFNPALWLASREIRRERELACDELVLAKSSIEREDYASGYVAALKMANRRSGMAASLAMAEPLDVEKRRLQMILMNPVARMSLYWIVGLAVVAMFVLPTFAGISRNNITAQDIADALKQQEAACGGSLEVAFNMEHGPEDSRCVEKRRYIRTPDKLFEQSHRPYGSMVTYTYDRHTGEARKLIVDKPGSALAEARGEYSGLIGSFNDTPFGCQDMVETVQYSIFDGPLCDVIGRGTVSKTMESIDSFMCYRVDIPSSEVGTHKKYIVWVDPDIGYCPRMIHIVWTNSPPQVISFKDYKEAGNGVWFPMKMTVDLTTEAGEHVNVENTVVDVRAGRVFRPEELKIDFPAGTEVHVREGARYRSYIEPDKGAADNSSDLLAGLKAVEGPGVVITLHDSPQLKKSEKNKDIIKDYLVHDYDIREVVNELFASGAEAISVNEQRVVAYTAIRCEGPVVTVNSISIRPPYVVRAIGNSDVMTKALTAKGGPAQMLFLLDMIKVEKSSSIILPAYKGKPSFRYAKPVN